MLSHIVLLLLFFLLCSAPVVASPTNCQCGEYYSDASGRCATCTPGYYCRGGFGDRAQCSPGTYAESSGTCSQNGCPDTCLAMGPFFVAPAGSLSCSYCTDQGVSSDRGRCIQCQPGSGPSETNGPGYCTTCAGGTFSPDGKACKPCPSSGAGEIWVSSAGAQNTARCEQCRDEDHTQADSLNTSCVCKPGYYQFHLNPSERRAAALAAGFECILCPVNQYAPKSGMSSCTTADREAGYYAPRTGMTAPDFCNGGHALQCSEIAGAPRNDTKCTCERCGTTQYSPARSTRCLDCPTGGYVQNAAGDGCECPHGLIEMVDAAQNKRCEACSAGYIFEVYFEAPPPATTAGQIRAREAVAMRDTSMETTTTPAPSNLIRKTRCKACPPGSFGPAPLTVGRTTTNSSFECVVCKANFFSTSEASTQCQPCAAGFGSDANSTSCFTITLELTRSNTSTHETDSHTVTVNWTDSNSLSGATPTESAETATEHRISPSNSTTITESDNIHESATTTLSFGSLSEPSQSRATHTAPSPSHLLQTESLSKTVEPTPFSDTISDSADSATHTRSNNFSRSISIPSATRTLRDTDSATISLIPEEPQQPLGLSPETAAALEQTGGVLSTLASVASASAAMSIGRGLSVLKLMGCPERAPDGKKWNEKELSFPASLIPGVGAGGDNGKFSRASVVAFLSLCALIFLLGWLSQETIGDGVASTATTATKDEKPAEEQRQQEQQPHDENTQVVTIPAEGGASDNATKQQQQQQQKKAPRVWLLFVIVNAVIGLWAPQAGLLFSTGEVGDIILAVVPFVAVFATHVWFSAKLIASLRQPHGVVFVPSFILEADRGVAATGFSASSPRNLFETKIGRFLLLGDYHWNRPRGPVGRPVAELLCSFGQTMQKLRGPIARVDWLSMQSPLTDNENFSGDPTDWATQDAPLVERFEADVATRIAPHYLLIAWIITAVVGFLQGIGLVYPDRCPVIAKVICAFNILAFIFSLWIRPEVVPLRNWVSTVLDGVVALVSILAAVLLISSHSNGDETGASSLEKLGKLATAMQVIIATAGTIATVVLCTISGTRFVLLRWKKARVASQEELWGLQQYRMRSISLQPMMNNNDDNNSESRRRESRRRDDSNRNNASGVLRTSLSSLARLLSNDEKQAKSSSKRQHRQRDHQQRLLSDAEEEHDDGGEHSNSHEGHDHAALLHPAAQREKEKSSQQEKSDKEFMDLLLLRDQQLRQPVKKTSPQPQHQQQQHSQQRHRSGSSTAKNKKADGSHSNSKNSSKNRK